MAYKRGTNTLQRHGTNYTQDQANARLKEVVKATQQKGINALGVDWFNVLFYYRVETTTLCTCQQTQIIPQHNTSLIPNLVKPKSLVDSDISIDFMKPLFGQTGDALNNDDYTEDDDFAIDEGRFRNSVDSMFSTNSNCGICYRNGVLPSYCLYGQQRHIYTTLNYEDAVGYTTDYSSCPHKFIKLDMVNGYIRFGLEIPKYVKEFRYSIRNNGDILKDLLYYNNRPLAFSDIKSNRFIQFDIRSEEFSHVVIELDSGSDSIHANIAQMSRTLDWTMMDTLASLNVTLPMTIRDVPSSSIIYVPERNITLRITDVPYLRTSKDENIDWNLSTRVVQPQELIKYIHKTTKLK
jgi:hypothetical protein